MTRESKPVAARLASLDWDRIERDLWARGYAETEAVLTAQECSDLVALYGDERRFRQRVEMARHRFGEGEYKYLAAPFPDVVQELRTHAYLLLHYESGGYNCLHQDLYGDVAFPMQLLCFLSRPGIDHSGGEFVLVEQRPRAQSAAEVVTGAQGALVFFTTRARPVRGGRGYYRVNVRHGVSRVRRGSRYTLGVIFHDAK